jgi:F0F1-type ATP synthase assembly protein I
LLGSRWAELEVVASLLVGEHIGLLLLDSLHGNGGLGVLNYILLTLSLHQLVVGQAELGRQQQVGLRGDAR